VIITASIIGASFLIWLIPDTGSTGTSVVFSDYNSTLSGLHARFLAIDAELDSQYSGWRENHVKLTDMLQSISASKNQTKELIQNLVDSKPPSEWQDRYIAYGKSLQQFQAYLDTLERRILSENRSSMDIASAKLRAEPENTFKAIYKNSS